MPVVPPPNLEQALPPPGPPQRDGAGDAAGGGHVEDEGAEDSIHAVSNTHLDWLHTK